MGSEKRGEFQYVCQAPDNIIALEIRKGRVVTVCKDGSIMIVPSFNVEERAAIAATRSSHENPIA